MERKPWICPACGVGCAPHVDHCGACAFKAAFKPYEDAIKQVPQVPVLPGVTYIPGVRPCLFDGLPPGVYGIACPCPMCSPHCVSVPSIFSCGDDPPGQTSYTITMTGDSLAHTVTETVVHGQRIGGAQHYA